MRGAGGIFYRMFDEAGGMVEVLKGGKFQLEQQIRSKGYGVAAGREEKKMVFVCLV